MEDFPSADDYELWDRVNDNPKIPIRKATEGNNVKNERSESTLDDLIALKKNAKSENILVCGLGQNEYNRIFGCTTAKKTWDAIVNSHEATSQVRFRVATLSTEYEEFKMKTGESMQNMITRLTSIVNELVSLEKTYY